MEGAVGGGVDEGAVGGGWMGLVGGGPERGSKDGSKGVKLRAANLRAELGQGIGTGNSTRKPNCGTGHRICRRGGRVVKKIRK